MKKNIAFQLIAVFISFYIRAQTYTIITSPDPATYSANGWTNALAPSGHTVNATLRAVFFVDQVDLTAIPSMGTDISSIGFAYTNSLLAVPASGTLTVYMCNTSDMGSYQKSTAWSTATVGMTQVYDNIMNIPTGTVEATVDLPFPTNFGYTGHSLYVAYNWVGATFDPSNMAVYKGWFVSSSTNLGVFGDDAVNTDPENLQLVFMRPIFRFGLAHNATAINENNFPADYVDLYPNPCNRKLIIKNRSDIDSSEICIRNLVGDVLISKNISGEINEVNMEALNPGIYMVSIKGMKEIVMKRIVVEK